MTRRFQQLHSVANSLPGMEIATGMPDLHAGRTFPVGASFVTAGLIYPPLIVCDIGQPSPSSRSLIFYLMPEILTGCGMALYQTELAGNSKPSKLVGQLHGLERPWAGDSNTWLNEREVGCTAHDASLGTIGGGHHFSELQTVESVVNMEEFTGLGLSQNNLFILAHSSSREYGESVFQDYLQALELRYSIKILTPRLTT